MAESYDKYQFHFIDVLMQSIS